MLLCGPCQQRVKGWKVEDQPEYLCKPSKEKSRTALALEDVQQHGRKVAHAARAYGVSRASVYRLMKYRAARQVCPVCGSIIKAKK